MGNNLLLPLFSSLFLIYEAGLQLFSTKDADEPSSFDRYCVRLVL